MKPTNILVISIVIGTLFTVLDVYVLSRWRSAARRNGMNPWWYRIPIGIGIVMLAVYWIVVVRRHFFRMDGIDLTMFRVVMLWALPKVGIALVLLVNDIYRGFRWLYRKGRAALATTTAEVPVVDTERRAMLSKAGWALGAAPYVIVANGTFRGVHDFTTHGVDIVLPGLPRAFEGMRIVQLSDIHAGSFSDHRPFQEVRRIVDGIKPDMIVITGDWVNAVPDELSTIAQDVPKLRAPLGVLASLGNHDHYNSDAQHAALQRHIRSMGVDLLVNDRRILTEGGERLVIAGTDNTGLRQQFARLDRALRDVERSDSVILMAHDPTYFEVDVRDSMVDLMLSGHTHGGQFGVNILGMEWSPAQYVYKHWAGLYREGSQQIYVNRGLGTVGPPMRIGMPPEITVLTLRRG